MRRTILLAATAALGPLSTAPEAAEPAPPSARLVYEDDFARGDQLARWRTHPNSFLVKGGVLVAAQQPGTTHGAVGRVPIGLRDVVAEFDFQFAGSPRFNVVFDDPGYKGSHSGHIARVVVTPKALTIRDDKEGVFRNDIVELRQDPKTKDRAEAMLEGRSATVPVELERGRWYRMRVAVAGDEMRVSLDGKPAGSLKSPGLAHATKADFGFTVSDDAIHFDNMKIWAPDETSPGAAPR